MRGSPTQVKLRSKTVHRVRISVRVQRGQSSRRTMATWSWGRASPLVPLLMDPPLPPRGIPRNFRGEGQPCCTSTDIRSRRWSPVPRPWSCRVWVWTSMTRTCWSKGCFSRWTAPFMRPAVWPSLPTQRRSISQCWTTSCEWTTFSLIIEFVFTYDGEIQTIAVVVQKFRRFIEPLIGGWGQ